ncbi:LIM and SH3 domain protein F42H10.3-like isoform X11 [Ostrea edulis]|uniref:LIM and SH3 domain protein F42H10.3-like isoform X11 n=1 Tax=Ostrea edulis TaxID=37623 RepID=UPI0024AF9A91|nr:LIM and SH3 domain protein F42H10.3-like isoform X11 [Ostrea edulis]
MNKKCAKCEKTVYPTEELKCLDKFWHKPCFKCDVCNMTLNMKNYKGYNKIPYCNVHYPTTSFTAVADTPENQRIKQNTKVQSNVQYHSDFEKQKGAYTQVVDTPDMIRHQQNTKNISLIKYHADFEKMKGKKLTVVDDPETMRIKQNTAIQSNVEYHKVRDQLSDMEQRRPDREAREGPTRTQPGKITDYEPETNAGGTPYSMRNSQARVVYDSNIGKVEDAPSRRVGSISDYDPLNNQFGSIGRYSGGDPAHEPPRGYQQPPPQSYQQPPPQSYQQPPPQSYQPPPPQSYQPPPPQPAAASEGMVCKAMYDYTSADADEVSFQEDDLIINCQPIDEGWMEGTVKRTGQRGMLPSNYVEQVN